MWVMIGGLLAATGALILLEIHLLLVSRARRRRCRLLRLTSLGGLVALALYFGSVIVAVLIELTYLAIRSS